MTTYEAHGRWWLPNHEDHPVPGIFRWDAEKGGKLLLLDTLVPITWRNNRRPDGSVQRVRANQPEPSKDYPIILGRSGRDAYTLLRSFSSVVQRFDTDTFAETVVVNDFLKGAWFTEENDLHGDTAIFEIRHLTDWVDHSGLKTVHPFMETAGDRRFGVVTATQLPDLTVDLDDVTVSLTQQLSGTGDQTSLAGFTQSWDLVLKYDGPRTLAESVALGSDFQDLISIASGRHADIERATLQHPDLPLLSAGGTPLGEVRADIAYHTRWARLSTDPTRLSSLQMYFTLSSFGGIEGVGRWMATAKKYRTELRRVMATRDSEHMYVEDRIMNASAALDGLDMIRRQTDKRVLFRDRLGECVTFAGEPFRALVPTNADAWLSAAKEARHDIGHHRERFRLEGRVGDHLLAEQLYWLFVLCVLRLSAAPQSAFESIMQHPTFRWLAEQAAAGNAE